MLSFLWQVDCRGKPGVLEHVLESGAHLRKDKDPLEERLCHWVAISEPRGNRISQLPDERFRFVLLPSVEWGAAIEQLKEHDAKAPDVHSLVIVDHVLKFREAVFEHLDWVELKGTNSQEVLLFDKLIFLDCKAEVSNENVQIFVDKHIFRLQVTMKNALLVDLNESFDELYCYLFHIDLWQSPLRGNSKVVVHVAIRVKRKNQVDAFVIVAQVKQLDAPSDVLDFVEYGDLTFDAFEDVLLIDLLIYHLLDANSMHQLALSVSGTANQANHSSGNDLPNLISLSDKSSLSKL